MAKIASIWRAIKRWFGQSREEQEMEIPQEIENTNQLEETPQNAPAQDASNRKWLTSSMAGIVLITSSEGFFSEPYPDPVGIPTIGYGTIRYPDGRRVTLSDPPISKAQAREYFRAELEEIEEGLNKWLDVHNIDLNINQFSALVSFAYNLGLDDVVEGKIATYLKAGDHNAVTSQMLKYVKAKNRWGIYVKFRGLEIRRKREVDLYNSPVKEVANEQ